MKLSIIPIPTCFLKILIESFTTGNSYWDPPFKVPPNLTPSNLPQLDHSPKHSTWIKHYCLKWNTFCLLHTFVILILLFVKIIIFMGMKRASYVFWEIASALVFSVTVPPKFHPIKHPAIFPSRIQRDSSIIASNRTPFVCSTDLWSYSMFWIDLNFYGYELGLTAVNISIFINW
jgi:hypothetical protein